MLEIVENIKEDLNEVSTQLVLDDNFLKSIEKGKKLQLRNFNDQGQFFIEVMNNKKPKKNDIILNPFQRSVYARGYQCFLTHENGKAKLIFDNKNWIVFDIVSFAL
jgi:hypothetical protein